MTFNDYEADRLKTVILAFEVAEMPAEERESRFGSIDVFEIFRTYTDAYIRRIVDFYKGR